MYTFKLGLQANTTFVANTWKGPIGSIKPGSRAIRLRGVKFDSLGGTGATYPVFVLVVRRAIASTGGGVATPFAMTLDNAAPGPSPQFISLYSLDGANMSVTASPSDEEVYFEAGGTIGLTEWDDGDITNLAMPAYDLGSLDIYMATPNAGAIVQYLEVLIEENPFRTRYDLAGSRTDALKSGIVQRR